MSSAETAPPGPAIDIDDVTVRFGDGSEGLRGLSLRVDQGERIALIGPSGAGKTTLLRLVPALVNPTSGAVRVLGHDLSELAGRRLRDVRRDIGMVTQGLDLPGSLRVVHNVAAGKVGGMSTPRALAHLAWPTDRPEIDHVLSTLGLPGATGRRTDELSGGQRQRVAVARVLYQAPRIMLADEPVSSLDPDTADDVLERLTDAARQASATLLMSIHAPERAVAFADRIVGIRDGAVVMDVPSDRVDPERIDAVYRGALDPH